MKFQINFKNLLFLPIIAGLIFLTGCQNEVTDVTTPNNQQIISANSNLATLINQTASLDGSLDNIIDFANCLSVDLPVTVIVNGVEITIDSEDDFEVIEAVFDEFNDDEDNIEIIFPITVILSDYTQIVIQDYSELETYIDDCNGENEEDDDIECIDFQYPIVFSVYNSNFQVIETVTIENDEALYVFIESLEGGVLASLNFPVTLILSDGSTFQVNSNTELEAAIEAAENDCDEDDDNDWNDDDYDCTEENIIANLIECNWVIVAYNGDDNYIEYSIEFNENGSFYMHEEMVTSAIGGAWEMSISNDGWPELVITQITAFQDDLLGSWVIVECDDDRLEMTMGDNTMVMEQDCTDNNSDCTQLQVEEFLLECPQIPTLNDFTPSLTTFEFLQNNVLSSLYEGDLPYSGTWDISTDANGVFIVISFNGLENFNGFWYVTVCNENQLILEQGDDVLILESNCVESPFECFGSFEAELVACDDDGDGFTEFDLESVFANCINNDVDVTYHETLADAQAGMNALVSPYSNIVSLPQTIYVRAELINNPNEFEIFDITLLAENCAANCTEADVDSYLLECIWNVVSFNGSDDLIIYDMDFESSGTVVIFTDTVTIDATWSTSQSASGVILEFGNVSGANIQAITGNWTIIDCDEDRLEMIQGNDTMVIEKDCS